jgi:catechol 2,3-dioxygenase-like lactoylglutathione lyase family enzyme
MARINHIALKVTDLETATKFYENVYGFKQVRTGQSRGHISRHMTDGYIDLALMIYDSEDDDAAKLVGPGRRSTISVSRSRTTRLSPQRSQQMAARSCRSLARCRSNTAHPTVSSPRSCRWAAMKDESG